MFWQLMADSWLEPMRFARRIKLILISYQFDKNIILLAGILSAIFNFTIKIPILLIALIYFDSIVSINLLIIPFLMLLTISFGTSLSCFITPLSLGLLDIRYSAPLIQYALLFATPIFYTQFESGIVALVNIGNPFTYVIPLYRDMILGISINIELFYISSTLILSLLAIGLKYYSSKIGLAIAYIGK